MDKITIIIVAFLIFGCKQKPIENLEEIHLIYYFENNIKVDLNKNLIEIDYFNYIENDKLVLNTKEREGILESFNKNEIFKYQESIIITPDFAVIQPNVENIINFTIKGKNRIIKISSKVKEYKEYEKILNFNKDLQRILNKNTTFLKYRKKMKIIIHKSKVLNL